MPANPTDDRISLQGDPAEPSFLLLYCADCQREVLSACELDPDSDIIDICLHCEAKLDREDGSARWVDAQALDGHGYFVDGHETNDKRHGGGGCRGKSCGIQQPE